jgi:hypothetical protein
VPKSAAAATAIEDGNKRVSSKPKWSPMDQSVPTVTKSNAMNSSSSQSRRRSPQRRRDDYRDERSIRRSGSNRGNVPSSQNRNAPRGSSSATTNNSGYSNNNSNSNTNSNNMKPIRSTTSSRRDNNSSRITRSTMPSYTESKTPGLNGNPIIKSDPYIDAKKSKPLIGQPIIIEAPLTPIVTNLYGTYYFNGPAPFTTLDTIAIKESIKKQM